jgi:nucleoside-diphosphate-sugar epimerase
MYIVTGASGWLGITTLLYLRDQLNLDLNADVLCFSSTEKVVSLPDGQKVKSLDLKKIQDYTGTYEGIFHFAFLTRDFIGKIGYTNYVQTNQGILLKMDSFLHGSDFKWIVSVSSGAVFDSPNGKLTSSLTKNPYGYLKLQEEKLLLAHAERSYSASVVGRLWGCTGFAMPPNRKYAISDFIIQGLETDQINVTSCHEVWRRFIDAQNFIKILHMTALDGVSRTMDSAGELVEIGELARKIGDELGAVVIRPEYDGISIGDYYYPDGLEMQAKATQMGLKFSTMDEQVIDTIKGHRLHLEKVLKGKINE